LLDYDGQDGDELYGNWGNDLLSSQPYQSGYDAGEDVLHDEDLLDGGKHEDSCDGGPPDNVVNCEL
jgi:Ca2+-binding RTX toxin-like protein